jgi:hypothetical protein
MTKGIADSDFVNEVSSEGVELRENMHKREKENITH